VSWLQTEAKIVAGASFISCLSAEENQHQPAGPLHVKVYGCMLHLTCSSGAAVTLVYSAETTAALWALRCLTEGIDGVLGAIQSGNLMRWEGSFWQSTETIPDRKATKLLMRKAVRLWTRHGKSYAPLTDSIPSIGAPPNVSRETPEEM